MTGQTAASSTVASCGWGSTRARRWSVLLWRTHSREGTVARVLRPAPPGGAQVGATLVGWHRCWMVWWCCDSGGGTRALVVFWGGSGGVVWVASQPCDVASSAVRRSAQQRGGRICRVSAAGVPSPPPLKVPPGSRLPVQLPPPPSPRAADARLQTLLRACLLAQQERAAQDRAPLGGSGAKQPVSRSPPPLRRSALPTAGRLRVRDWVFPWLCWRLQEGATWGRRRHNRPASTLRRGVPETGSAPSAPPPPVIPRPDPFAPGRRLEQSDAKLLVACRDAVCRRRLRAKL